MRISDWSSDVCSSDLPGPPREGFPRHPAARRLRAVVAGALCERDCPSVVPAARTGRGDAPEGNGPLRRGPPQGRRGARLEKRHAWFSRKCRHFSSCGKSSFYLSLLTRLSRSEEHTSELQSLMRISYAVFCLKKKK